MAKPDYPRFYRIVEIYNPKPMMTRYVIKCNQYYWNVLQGSDENPLEYSSIKVALADLNRFVPLTKG